MDIFGDDMALRPLVYSLEGTSPDPAKPSLAGYTTIPDPKQSAYSRVRRMPNVQVYPTSLY